LFGNYILPLITYGSTFVSLIYFGGCAILAYYDKSMNYPLISLIIWVFILVIYTMQMISILAVSFIGYLLLTLYFKYRFQQIREVIKYAVDRQRNILILVANIDHDKCVKLLTKIDNVCKIAMACVYCMAPFVDLLIYFAMSDIQWYARISAIIIAIETTLSMSILTYSCAKVSKYAHSPYSYLNSYLAKHRVRILYKLKISGFIEKLAGPSIGFYCLDLFPFTNYEFYLFVANTIKIYFLMLSLIK
jgi:hypothetical protein